MAERFHEGELAVQAREGVQTVARRVGGIIGETFPSGARDFLAQQRMLVVASVSPEGHVWGSLLTGEEGFLEVADARTLRIASVPHEGDPLHASLRSQVGWGALAIEFATRRRMKVKGRAEVLSGGGYLLHARAVYGLCPRYIQAREVRSPGTPAEAVPTPVESARMTEAQQRQVRSADTFFLCTAHAEAGADASHRGGNPGFVRVLGPDRLEVPDYAGNNMFNSLGNLELSPRAGLLFLDFERGGTLQLSGEARATWEPERLALFPGARRVLEFHVAQVREVSGISPLRWRFLEPSRFNPS
jgi:predicted pyridoxine 5'-phosphate oxidase superfamily flavin-nucleotide-binding protein